MTVSVFDMIGYGVKLMYHRADIERIEEILAPVIAQIRADMPELIQRVGNILASLDANTATHPAVASGGSYGLAWVQERLTVHGYPLTIDGLMGPATAAAIEAFQIKNGIQVSRTADLTTCVLLMEQV